MQVNKVRTLYNHWIEFAELQILIVAWNVKTKYVKFLFFFISNIRNNAFIAYAFPPNLEEKSSSYNVLPNKSITLLFTILCNQWIEGIKGHTY